jgi:hypothetical protein
MLTYTTANTEHDLQGILKLQKANLAQGLSQAEIESQGFVTVSHTYDQLKKLNDSERHIIAKDNDKVAAYLLAMTQHSRSDIPILVPMFELFENISYKNEKITTYNYLVVGQACVGREYRGQGVLDSCYEYYQRQYQGKYDFAITEIASSNLRSRKAHARVGFEEIHTYVSPDKTEWIVVLWNWRVA